MMFLTNIFKIFITLLLLIMTFNNCKLLSAAEPKHVYCNEDFLSVKLPLTSNHSEMFITRAYWQNLHSTIVKECQPLHHARGMTFKISVKNFAKCGFWRSVNKWQKQVSYQQYLIIKRNFNITSKINIKCIYKFKTNIFKHKLVKRANLPENFKEDESIEVLETLEQNAPEPGILMEVRQNGQLIDGNVTVIPGTPLIMEIKLQEMANEVYGLNVNYLQVADNAEMSETILFRGCTVDPYLFENFNLTANNSLESKFRAFKFPNTAFVQFRANVQICLKKCPMVQCIGSNTQKEEKRRKRDLSPAEHKLYEVHGNFVLNVKDSLNYDNAEFQRLQAHVNRLSRKHLQLSDFK